MDYQPITEQQASTQLGSQFKWNQFVYPQPELVPPVTPLPSLLLEETAILPTLTPSSNSELPTSEDVPVSKKRRPTRYLALATIPLFALLLFFTWRISNPSVTPTTMAPTNNQVSIHTTTLFQRPTTITPTSSNSLLNGEIQVYVVGAVKHPGVYVLPASARVYQLLQAAGGPEPGANLVALNMAARLSDGQEVYVTKLGEAPPTYVGGVPGSSSSATPTSSNSGNQTPGTLVNINSASTNDLRQNLHVSAKTAQNIVNYRLEHGPYTSIDQLLQVVSQSIFAKIKDKVTV